MSAIRKTAEIVSPEEYLRGEAKAKRKHEYLGGMIHAMAGGRNVHHTIASNILIVLGSRLRGKKCRAFNSDAKVRLKMPSGQIRFYYPDTQVVCDPNPPEETFQERPVLVVEVTSPSSWRTDHVEKYEGYTAIPTLEWYLIVDSTCCEVLVHQRVNGVFQPLLLSEMHDKITLESLGIDLPLAEIYADVVFPPQTDEVEDED